MTNDHSESARLQIAAAQTSLAKAINQTHADCLASDTQIEEAVLRKINKARECGLFLIEAKQLAGHSRWATWVREHLTFSIDTAKLYIRFAKANREPVTDLVAGINSLKDAMIACGALAAPNGHGEQNRSTSTFLDRFSDMTQRVYALFNGRLEKEGDVSTWSEAERRAAKAQLEPLVKVYQQL